MYSQLGLDQVTEDTETAEIVLRANTQWPNSKVPKDRDARQELLEEIEETAAPIWEECDAEFCEYQDDITGLLINLVKVNRAEFE